MRLHIDTKSAQLGFLLVLTACGDSSAPSDPIVISEGVATAVRYALLARGAKRSGPIKVHIEDSVAVGVDSLVVRDALTPWELDYIDHDAVERWMINGASDCPCSAVVYLAVPPRPGGRFLTQDVAVAVPMVGIALYRVVVLRRGLEWRLNRIDVITIS